MPGSAFLNIPLIMARINGAAEETLDTIGDLIAADARYRAPIRKAFKEKAGYKRKFRDLTPSEKSQATNRANNYYTHIQPDEFKRRRAVSHIQNYARVQIRRPSSANTIANSKTLRHLGVESRGRFTSTTGATRVYSAKTGKLGFNPGPVASEAMTSRGRSEARSGASIHRAEGSSGTNIQIGGALKASIESSGAIQTGMGWVVTVGAYIRYAKYVEFPTVRTASQPFLLPALHDQRQKLKQTFSANLRKAFGGR